MLAKLWLPQPQKESLDRDYGLADIQIGRPLALWWQHKILSAPQIVGKGFQDPDKKVRGQAMFALGELAAHCQPEMSKHAGEALPHVFAAMAEDDATLQEQACYALDSFCENLGELCPLANV